MLGWHISVYRQADGGKSPAKNESTQGARIAVWQTGLEGLSWLDDLVKMNQAVDLGGNGYPNHYTAQSKHLIRQIVDGPHRANKTWVCGPQDTTTSKWAGKTVIDSTVAEDCRPDEWLLVEAWDES